MRWVVLSAMTMLLAQQAAPPAAPQAAAQIKQELDKIKKGRTLPLLPTDGAEDAGAGTRWQVDNTSPFDLVVLIVGPTTERVTLGPYRMQTLNVKPGEYEVAVTVPGRDVPPFYGKQKITAKKLFRHKLSIPGV